MRIPPQPCKDCGAITELLVNGKPQCPKCYKTVSIIHDSKEQKSIVYHKKSIRNENQLQHWAPLMIDGKRRHRKVYQIGKDLFTTKVQQEVKSIL